jgi:hypothetical protein
VNFRGGVDVAIRDLNRLYRASLDPNREAVSKEKDKSIKILHYAGIKTF